MIDNRRKWGPMFQCSALAVLLVAGCRRSPEASVYGTVTLDGKPLAAGTVAFHPANRGAIAYAGIHSDGTFRLSTGTNQGLAAGEYAVTVVASETPLPGKAGLVVGKLLTPARYGKPESSGLRFTVTSGNSKIDLGLTSN